MKFLSVNPNLSVRKEEIVAVERNDSGLGRIVLNSFSYDTDWPYETLLTMIEIPDIEEKIKENIQTPMSRSEAYHKPMQYFAG